jgi:hypothetical protein
MTIYEAEISVRSDFPRLQQSIILHIRLCWLLHFIGVEGNVCTIAISHTLTPLLVQTFKVYLFEAVPWQHDMNYASYVTLSAGSDD